LNRGPRAASTRGGVVDNNQNSRLAPHARIGIERETVGELGLWPFGIILKTAPLYHTSPGLRTMPPFDDKLVANQRPVNGRRACEKQ
jgi:hypothetical protein